MILLEHRLSANPVNRTNLAENILLEYIATLFILVTTEIRVSVSEQEFGAPNDQSIWKRGSQISNSRSYCVWTICRQFCRFLYQNIPEKIYAWKVVLRSFDLVTLIAEAVSYDLSRGLPTGIFDYARFVFVQYVRIVLQCKPDVKLSYVILCWINPCLSLSLQAK